MVAISTALELRRRGHRVGYIAGNDKADTRLEEAGVELLLLNQKSFFEEPDRNLKLKKLRYNPAIDAPVRDFLGRFNNLRTVVHAHTFRLKLSGRVPALCAELKFPLVMHGHDYSPMCPTSLYFNHREGRNCDLKPMSWECIKCECQGLPWRYKAPKLLSMHWNQQVAKLNERSHAMLYPSQLAHEVMLPFVEGPAEHVEFRPIGKEATSSRVAAEDNREFMFIGRVTVEKGPELLLKAGRKLGFPVAVIGDGPLMRELRAKYPEARFAGWLDPEATAAELSKARALVVPSLWRETLCLSVIDALQVGVPCVVSSTVGAKQYIDSNGLVFESGNEAALAEALSGFEQYEAVRAMSERAFATFAEDRPTVEAAVDQLIEIYKRAQTRNLA